MNRFFDQNYYELLEIPMDAPQQEVRRAYQRAKETYSKESPALYTMFTDKEAEELSNLIEEAFRILGDQYLRQEYNLKLRRQGTLRVNHNISDLPTQSKGKKNNSSFPIREKNFAIPEGFKRTKLSVYKIDPEFEEEVKSLPVFNGDFLKKVRNYKGISLDQMSDETRISRQYLEAIEENRIQDLPAPVFVRGFLIQIAKILGLSEKKMLNSYLTSSQVS